MGKSTILNKRRVAVLICFVLFCFAFFDVVSRNSTSENIRALVTWSRRCDFLDNGRANSEKVPPLLEPRVVLFFALPGANE